GDARARHVALRDRADRGPCRSSTTTGPDLARRATDRDRRRVHVDPMPVDVHQRELLDPAEMLLRHDLHVDDVTIIRSVGDQGRPATIIHPPSSLDWLIGSTAT